MGVWSSSFFMHDPEADGTALRLEPIGKLAFPGAGDIQSTGEK